LRGGAVFAVTAVENAISSWWSSAIVNLRRAGVATRHLLDEVGHNLSSADVVDAADSVLLAAAAAAVMDEISTTSVLPHQTRHIRCSERV